MRVIEVREFGGPEVLVEVERPAPVARAGRVTVRMRATTINPVDQFVHSGAAVGMAPHRPPPVLGWDLAGVVTAYAGGFTAGQRVVGMVPWFVTGAGTYAEIVAAEPGWLTALPDRLDDATAATLALNGLTARQALDLAAIPPGGTLVVTGASGAVGGYAVQLAAADGVEVLAVASPGDEAWAAGLGAQHVLGAKHVLARAEPAELVAAVRALVPDGVDGVLDAAAAAPALIGAVRDGGTFVGVTPPSTPAGERGIRTVTVDVAPDAAAPGLLVAAAAEGRLRTRVAGTLPLAEASRAHERAAAGGLRGKLVLTG